MDLTTYNQVEQVDLMMYNQADLIMFLHLITSEAMLVKRECQILIVLSVLSGLYEIVMNT